VLHDLLLPDPNDDADLAARLLRWRSSAVDHRAVVEALGSELRGRDWDRCAAEIVALAERA